MSKPNFQSSFLFYLISLSWLGIFAVMTLLTTSMICGAIVNDDVKKASGSCLAVTARRVLRMQDRWNETEYGEPGQNPFPVAVEGVVRNAQEVDKSIGEFASGNTDLRLAGVPEEYILTRDEKVDALVARQLYNTIYNSAVEGDSTKIYGTANAWSGMNSILGVDEPNVQFRNKDGTKIERAIYLVKGGGKIDITSRDKGKNTGMVIKIDLPDKSDKETESDESEK